MSVESTIEQSTTSQGSIRDLVEVVVDSDETSTESDLSTQQEVVTFYVVNRSSIGQRLLAYCKSRKFLLCVFVGLPLMGVIVTNLYTLSLDYHDTVHYCQNNETVGCADYKGCVEVLVMFSIVMFISWFCNTMESSRVSSMKNYLLALSSLYIVLGLFGLCTALPETTWGYSCEQLYETDFKEPSCRTTLWEDNPWFKWSLMIHPILMIHLMLFSCFFINIPE